MKGQGRSAPSGGAVPQCGIRRKRIKGPRKTGPEKRRQVTWRLSDIGRAGRQKGAPLFQLVQGTN